MSYVEEDSVQSPPNSHSNFYINPFESSEGSEDSMESMESSFSSDDSNNSDNSDSSRVSENTVKERKKLEKSEMKFSHFFFSLSTDQVVYCNTDKKFYKITKEEGKKEKCVFTAEEVSIDNGKSDKKKDNNKTDKEK